MKTVEYDNPEVGCYIDESAGSADDCNRRTISFAEDYGYEAKVQGCFDGLRGLYLEMTIDEAESASHQGQCDEDVAALAAMPHIAAQLDAIGADKIRLAMEEVGAWDADELANNEQNRLRAVWQAACDAKENLDEYLSEMSDEAVEYLNSLETRSFMYWTFDDNSLFLMANVESASEDVGFKSVKSLADARRMGIETDPKDSCYPPADYRGEWLHVSDHGNATLYCRNDDGKDVEIWSVV
jgi:hypothetical protein